MADDSESERREETAREERLTGRRDFLRGLRKWSAAVIGGAILGHLAAPEARAGWINRRGGWVNGAGGGGSWVNRGGGGGGSWVNRGGGGWVNNRGGSWVNR
jgi:hypothetical protein